MRLGILSDIHGTDIALKKCLSYLRESKSRCILSAWRLCWRIAGNTQYHGYDISTYGKGTMLYDPWK